MSKDPNTATGNAFLASTLSALLLTRAFVGAAWTVARTVAIADFAWGPAFCFTALVTLILFASREWTRRPVPPRWAHPVFAGLASIACRSAGEPS